MGNKNSSIKSDGEGSRPCLEAFEAKKFEICSLSWTWVGRVKRVRFLTILRSNNHFVSAWKVPGSLASALASAWEVSDIVSMHFEAKTETDEKTWKFD